MSQAETLFLVVQIWGGVGLIVTVVFLSYGIDKIDEDARGAYVFRPLLIPGILLIWPLVLWRWYVLADGKDEWSHRYKPRRHTHQWFAFAMPVAIVVILLSAASIRQTWPADVAPIMLEGPPG